MNSGAAEKETASPEDFLFNNILEMQILGLLPYDKWLNLKLGIEESIGNIYFIVKYTG